MMAFRGVKNMKTWAFSRLRRAKPVILTMTVSAFVTGTDVSAQEDVFSQYREMMGEDNPAVFLSEEGADYWSRSTEQRKSSLEQCDLGLGPGVVEGAYARLPRYFEDTGRVMDLEARLFH